MERVWFAVGAVVAGIFAVSLAAPDAEMMLTFGGLSFLVAVGGMLDFSPQTRKARGEDPRSRLPALFALGLLGFCGSAFAQPTTQPLITPGATAWFALLGGVVALGVVFVRQAVAFVLARSWGAWFNTGDRPILLSLLVSVGWVFFFFQPGLLNLEDFKVLPLWEAYFFSIVGIAWAASGGVDFHAQKLAMGARAEAEAAKEERGG
jgi:hypothetical protein